jgi:hypothetical protein
MVKKLLACLLILVPITLMGTGCASEDLTPAAPPKQLSDAEFEASIAKAPPQAQEQARKEREKGQYLSGQGRPAGK